MGEIIEGILEFLVDAVVISSDDGNKLNYGCVFTIAIFAVGLISLWFYLG